MVAHHGGEAVEALAHVAGLQRDVDLEVAVEGEHGGGPQASWRRSLASSLSWPVPAARATTPPGKRTSTSSPDGVSPISASRKAGAFDRCLVDPGNEPRRLFHADPRWDDVQVSNDILIFSIDSISPRVSFAVRYTLLSG